MSANGGEVALDDNKIFKLLKKAADNGDACAQYNLGWMYRSGRGVEQNDKEAVELYTKAADIHFGLHVPRRYRGAKR